MEHSLLRKCSQYTLSVIALLIGTEVVYKCIQYFFAYLRRERTGKMVYYKVLFFPDKGILSSMNYEKSSTDITDTCDTNGGNLDTSLCLRTNSSENYCATSLNYNCGQLQNDDPTLRRGSLGSSFDPLQKSTSLIHMVNVLDSADRSLLICVYLISSSDLLDAIIRAKVRGVRVRVILDRSMSSVSNLSVLLKNSIPVRCSKLSQMMHHKFAIADAPVNLSNSYCALPTSVTVTTKEESSPDIRLSNSSQRNKQKNAKGVLMTGSFNWTWSGVISNFENVVITNDDTLVTAYTKEFEKLWELFSFSESIN